MKAKCGHFVEKSFAQTHDGLCRQCHSNFAFLVDLEDKYGDDALIEYWYAMILANITEDRERTGCFIEHLVEFYQRNLIEVPRKENYIRKMLYMLHSLQEPSNIESLR
ncbi:MAG: hypothetical protein DLM72_02390 [Candidatus Nitrosopolaris wilkensis]|nr:MAG: hypothetical protein DLM72_02390 [Candidatus Nitrosopolaris wilkensis]